MKTNFERVVEFNDTFGGALHIENQMALVLEEFKELFEVYFHNVWSIQFPEVSAPSSVVQVRARFLKEAIDLLYVTYGLLQAMGIDADYAFDKVHRSNMSKVGPDGKPVIDEETGKILKGPNYEPVAEVKLMYEATDSFERKYGKRDDD